MKNLHFSLNLKTKETTRHSLFISTYKSSASLCETLWKLVLKRVSPYINNVPIVSQTEFGFRKGHSTIHQIQQLTDSMADFLERKKCCFSVLHDVAQTFDKVWHPGILYKLKKILSPPYYLFFKSYLEDRYFITKVRFETSSLALISAGVPQGAISSPILFSLCLTDQPTTPHTSVADFADSKIIYSSNKNPIIAGYNLQNHLDLISSWYNK